MEQVHGRDQSVNPGTGIVESVYYWVMIGLFFQGL